MWVQSLAREDPLEEGMATHSSILAWRIPWTEEPGGLQSTGSQRVRESDTTEMTWHAPYPKLDYSNISILSVVVKIQNFIIFHKKDLS